jgi:peptidoglycan/LPS O-acetylase OafA/YrhL
VAHRPFLPEPQLSSTQIASETSPPQFMNGFRAKYVPALDGLRGVAILLVISHHQLIPYSLSGGFLGVDLFFVLSGFLITTLLLKEFDATETISLKNFYLRRVLRLGPALVLYLIASLVVTYQLHPAEFTRELRLVGLALAYSTNWRLAFGWDMTLDPTAIIWSLSIEEQFYLVWPLVLLVCLSLRLKRKHLIPGLIIVIAAIFLHRRQMLFSGVELNRIYYGTDTRADAPLMGCLLALIPHAAFTPAIQRALKLATVAAVCMLVYLSSTVHYTDTFLYRGGYTGIALLSGIMILAAVLQPSTWYGKVLEWPPLRFLGKISYGLYLWHWLLLKTTTFYFWVGPTWDPWARCAAAILVSTLSFYVIETPFNRLKTKFAFDSDRKRVPSAQPVPAMAALSKPVIIQPSEQV